MQAQWESRGTALLLTLTLDGVGGQCDALDALPLGKRPSTYCTGGWVGPRARPARCGKSRSLWDLIP